MSGKTPPPSADALLRSVLDYTGLFPPAKLELWDALRTYFYARSTPHAWLVDRFVLPHGLFFDLERQLDPFIARLEEQALDVGLILPGEEWEGAIEDAWGFNERWLGRAAVSAFEAPPLHAREITRLVTHLPIEFPVFFELPIAAMNLDELLAAVAASNRGAKVRCGGLDADSFPETSTLAAFVVACSGARVPFKATAGLQHPLQAVRPVRGAALEFDAAMQGFVNLASAACFAYAGRLDLPGVVALLDDGDPASFRFSGSELRWREYALDAVTIRRARRELFVSFGSCSINEPARDLEKLGLT